MRLTKTAIKQLRLNMRLRNRLALDLDKSPATINRWIADNDDSLTKAAVLRVIREETGMEDSELLEENRATA